MTSLDSGFMSVEGLALAALEALPYAIVFDRDLRLVIARGPALARHGLTPDRLEGQLAEDALEPERWAIYRPLFEAALRGETRVTEIQSRDQVSWYLVEVTPLRGDGGEVIGGISFAAEISDHRRDEAEREELRSRLMRVYGLVIDANGAIVRASTSEELFERVCRVAVDTAGFALAWVGLTDEVTGLVKPVACHGEIAYLDGLRVMASAADAAGRGPVGTTLREARPTIINCIRSDPRMRPWRERAIEYGFLSAAAFPLMHEGRVLGAFTVYAKRANFFTEEETGLLAQLASDMSLALQAKRHEAELRNAERFLQALTDSMAEGMFAVDEDGRVTYMNRAAERMLGWSEAELRGRSIREATECGASGAGVMASINSHEGPVVIDEGVFALRSGESLPVAYSASPINVGGTRGSVVVFSDITARKAQETRRQRELESLSWVGRISDALADDRFTLCAQPILDLRSGQTVSHELLVRMIDRHGEVVAPAKFLPTAERYGLIGEIDLWVVGQAVELAAAGHAVNFNLSAQSLERPDLVARIARAISASGAESRLTCEITETALASDADVAATSVYELAGTGCAIALDDFGTGYGGLTYLKRLPVQYIKIDIDFVRTLHESSENQHVVKAIVNLAEGFGKRTVAEGVEEPQTLELLRLYGVDLVQGFALGRPIPVRDAFASRGT
jgi:PAS domain S-box-containing protein